MSMHEELDQPNLRGIHSQLNIGLVRCVCVSCMYLCVTLLCNESNQQHIPMIYIQPLNISIIMVFVRTKTLYRHFYVTINILIHVHSNTN